MDKENLIVKTSPRYRRCGCVIGSICVLLSIFLAVCVTYTLLRYMPYFQLPCSSTPANKTVTLSLESSALLAQNSQPFNGNPVQTKTSTDPSINFKNLSPNAYLNKSCLREIEDSGKKWLLQSQNLTNDYLPDNNKTLHCPVTSLVPHDVLQKALDSYSSIKNMCRLEEQFADGFQMQYHIELKSAMDYKQRLQSCLTKQHCPKSGKNILLVYRDGHDKIGVAKNLMGRSKPTTITKANPFTSYSHITHFTTATCILNRALYSSGIGTNNNELWKFSTVKDEWTQLADMPSGRTGHCMVCVDNKIYILGGTAQSRDSLDYYYQDYYYHYPYYTTPKPNNTETNFRYDINTNKWNEIPSLQQYVQGAICVPYKHIIYVFGGRSESNMRVRTIQMFNPMNNTLSVNPTQMPTSEYSRSVVWKSKVLFFAHYEQTVFNLDTNSWGSMSQSFGFSSFSIIGTIGFTVFDDMLYHSLRSYTYGRSTLEIKAISLANQTASNLPKLWKTVHTLPNFLHMQNALAMYAYPCRDG